jgi:hypothetical protein
LSSQSRSVDSTLFAATLRVIVNDTFITRPIRVDPRPLAARSDIIWAGSASLASYDPITIAMRQSVILGFGVGLVDSAVPAGCPPRLSVSAVHEPARQYCPRDHQTYLALGLSRTVQTSAGSRADTNVRYVRVVLIDIDSRGFVGGSYDYSFRLDDGVWRYQGRELVSRIE